jgi:hypothetical protein
MAEVGFDLDRHASTSHIARAGDRAAPQVTSVCQPSTCNDAGPADRLAPYIRPQSVQSLFQANGPARGPLDWSWSQPLAFVKIAETRNSTAARLTLPVVRLPVCFSVEWGDGFPEGLEPPVMGGVPSPCRPR